MRSFCGVIKRRAIAGDIQRKRHTAIGINSCAVILILWLHSILRERSRRQKGADHHHGQQQTENSAQTNVVHNEILSFHFRSAPEAQTTCYSNASITFLVEL